MRYRKATAWGAGSMGAVGLVGAVLGPSPLVAPVAPLVAVAWAPFALATVALGMPAGLAEIGVGGKVAFVAWCAALGAGAGRLVGGWRARRRARRNEP